MFTPERLPILENPRSKYRLLRTCVCNFRKKTSQPFLWVDVGQMWNTFFVENISSFIFAMFDVCNIMIVNITNPALIKLWPPVVIVSLITRISSNVFYESLPRNKLIKRFRFFKWFPTSLQGLRNSRPLDGARWSTENLSNPSYDIDRYIYEYFVEWTLPILFYF